MTQVFIGDEKKHYRLWFFVQKTTGGDVGNLEFDFIGTEAKYIEFLGAKHQELAAEYSNVVFNTYTVLPPDSQLLFGNNQL